MQLEQTASALISEFGVDAEVSSELEPDLRNFDLVHLFGLVRPQDVWVQVRNAHRYQKPVVLSTVYCDVWEFEQFGRGGLIGSAARHSNRDVIEALKAVGRGIRSKEWSKGSAALCLRGFAAMQREIVSRTSVFLPNSESEWCRIVEDLGVSVPNSRVLVVPNAVSVDPSLAESPLTPRLESILEGTRDCVVSVARVEGRKNQLNLIRAIAGTDFTLVLAGKPAANQKRYVARVMAAASATPNVFVLGPVSEQEKWALLRKSRIHALPSWMETTGLSSLEAAVMNCALVVSPNGDTREYFGDEVAYCEPGDPTSIRRALEQAREAGPSAALAQRAKAELTWRQAALRTVEGYQLALSCRQLPRS